MATQAASSNPLELSPELLSQLSPTWQQYDGGLVMRVGDSPIIAFPVTGTRRSARFDIIDTARDEYLCQLTKKEVGTWLFTKAKAEWQDSL